MDQQEELEKVYQELIESEIAWDIHVIALWQFYNYCVDRFKICKCAVVQSNFPFSKKKQYFEYPASGLIDVIRVKGNKPNIEQNINLMHISELFSYIESMAKIFEPNNKNFHKREEIIAFLKDRKNVLDSSEVNEFILAKEARNCFLHQRGIIDPKLETAYKQARPGDTRQIKAGKYIWFEYYEYEAWHKMLAEIALNLKNCIKSRLKP